MNKKVVYNSIVKNYMHKQIFQTVFELSFFVHIISFKWYNIDKYHLEEGKMETIINKIGPIIKDIDVNVNLSCCYCNIENEYIILRPNISDDIKLELKKIISNFIEYYRDSNLEAYNPAGNQRSVV